MDDSPIVLRNERRNYQLPIREVHDRLVGTFEHSVESLDNNSFANIILPNLGEVGLVSKARNYSATPYDIMVACLSNDISALDRMTATQCEEFFGLLGDLYSSMSELSGMRIAVGINQHPRGFTLPEKDTLGNKTRVQTLQPLHAHIYEVSAPHEQTIRMGALSRADQRDICDPFISLASELVLNRLGKVPGLEEVTTSLSVATTPPWGLNLKFPMSASDFLKQRAGVLGNIQKEIFSMYDEWERILIPEKPVEERVYEVGLRLKSLSISAPSVRLLYLLAHNIKEAELGAHDLMLTKGPAATYTIYESENGFATLNLHPRLMSKGNSADAFGLYVNDEQGESRDEVLAKMSLYEKIIEEASKDYNITKGKFMQEDI